MADTKISDLPAVVTPAGTDAFAVAQGGSSKKITLSQVQAFASSTKLDDFAAPDDNTDLNASTSAHGLMMKYPGGTSNFLRADGAFAAPGGGTDPPEGSYAPGSYTIATGKFRVAAKRQQFTTTQRLTIAGTGRLSLGN